MSLKHLAGKVIVLEGPDGVGKTTLANLLVQYLSRKGRLDAAVHYVSFPGRRPGTLGELVYKIHHKQFRGYQGDITVGALQTMHVAAHIDTLQRVIIPALKAGETVVLDRSWWSTMVYGEAQGLDEDFLQSLISAEQQFWKGHNPHCVFLITSNKPYSKVAAAEEKQWRGLVGIYRRLAQEQKSGGTSVVSMANFDRTAQETLEHMLVHLKE